MNLSATVLLAGIFVFVMVTGIGNKTRQVSAKLPQRVIRNLFTPITLHDKTIPCFWLKHLKRQYKLCKKDPGLSDVLLTARDVAINSCEEQFRETALLYAVASSAITFAIARGCAEGKLINCNCEKEQDYQSNVEAWKWGFCSDNLKYAKKFTRKFLQLKRQGDNQNQIFRHDSLVGIETVAHHFKKKCRCPGLSGSCSIKICWKQIEPFKKISHVLKDKYQHALLSEIRNNAGNPSNRSSEKSGNLLYLLKSPTFCKSTPGRRCLNRENCLNLCCGRGYNTIIVTRIKHCNCRCVDQSCIKPQCDICPVEEEEYICKDEETDYL